jgi:hypothetical protein
MFTYRVSGELGVCPGLTEAMLDFVCEKIEVFFGVNF